MKKTGGCLCGAVRYEATFDEAKISACHCGMCRRWTGGPLISARAEIEFESEEHLRTYTSSDWAERGFCVQCGSSLFYRLTKGEGHAGSAVVAHGSLDDPSGFELTLEWFIDRKPDGYAFEGERKTLTEAEVFAMFAGGT